MSLVFQLGRVFVAMRCSRRAPASIAGSGTVVHNILARVPTKLQRADMLSGRSRRGARRHGRGRAVTLPQLSAIFSEGGQKFQVLVTLIFDRPWTN